jgi:hypothetical protein
VQVLKAADADVVCLQEAYEEAGGQGRNLAAMLAAALAPGGGRPLHYAFDALAQLDAPDGKVICLPSERSQEIVNGWQERAAFLALIARVLLASTAATRRGVVAVAVEAGGGERARGRQSEFKRRRKRRRREKGREREDEEAGAAAAVVGFAHRHAGA